MPVLVVLSIFDKTAPVCRQGDIGLLGGLVSHVWAGASCSVQYLFPVVSCAGVWDGQKGGRIQSSSLPACILCSYF